MRELIIKRLELVGLRAGLRDAIFIMEGIREIQRLEARVKELEYLLMLFESAVKSYKSVMDKTLIKTVMGQLAKHKEATIGECDEQMESL